MFSRVDSYTHNVSYNTAGGALVRVTAETDFALTGDSFVAFTKALAIQAYIHSETNWASLCEKAPELKAQFEELVAEVGEKIAIHNICVFLSPDQTAALEREGKTPVTASFE